MNEAIKNIESNLESGLANVQANTEHQIVNLQANTEHQIDNSTNEIILVIERSNDELKQLLEPKSNIVNDLTQVNIDAVQAKLDSLIVTPSPIYNILGGFSLFVDSEGNDKLITSGKALNLDSEEIKYDDDGVLIQMASVSKFICTVLIFVLMNKGIISFTTKISSYLPDWDYEKGKLVVFHNIKSLPDGSKTCTVNSDPESEVVQLLNSGGVPAWSTEVELDALKAKLTKLSRNIELQDFLYHTSGFAGDLFAPQMIPLQDLSEASLTSALSSFGMVYNYPSKIGVSTSQPGKDVLYDLGSLFVPGFVEIVYNNYKGIEVSSTMNLDPNYKTFNDIMGIELAPLVDCTTDDFSLNQISTTDPKTKKITSFLTSNEPLYLVNGIGSAYSQLSLVDGLDINTANFLPVSAIPASVPAVLIPAHSPLDIFNKKVASPKQISDFSGRLGSFSIKMLKNCSSVITNKGVFNGKRIVSTSVIEAKDTPLHPPSMSNNTAVDGDGSFLTSSILKTVSFTMLGVQGNPGKWLNGGTNMLDTGWKTLGDLGANGSVITYVGNNTTVISTVNNVHFYFRFVDGKFNADIGPNRRSEMYNLCNDFRIILTQNIELMSKDKTGYLLFEGRKDSII